MSFNPGEVFLSTPNSQIILFRESAMPSMLSYPYQSANADSKKFPFRGRSLAVTPHFASTGSLLLVPQTRSVVQARIAIFTSGRSSSAAGTTGVSGPPANTMDQIHGRG